MNEKKPFVFWHGRKVYEFDCVQYNTSPAFDRRPLHNISRTIKADSHTPAVCVRHEDIRDMKRNRDFHRHVRVVYRACRRLYGIEKTQDECLRLFKIVFPEYYRAKLSDKKYYQLSDAGFDKVDKLFSEWMPEDGALHDLLCYTFNELNRLMLREEFMQFCEDIMAVVMRIRKLTPRECGRLMGCDEETLDVMLNCGISNSSLYKLFGNSIVVDVMTAIFDKLFVSTEESKRAGEQLTLF